jgi:lysozyme family protein
MADFEQAYCKTLGCEGGYSNDRFDRGGETYRGVSRNAHGDWLGWGIIDSHREDEDFPECLGHSITLQREVRNFYLHEYWERMRGDAIDSQSVAEEIFDTSVNMGVRRATMFVQEACNALNRDEQLYPDLRVDGRFGPLTIRAVDTLLRVNDDEVLLVALNVLQGAFYLRLMQRDHSQERFARGWLKRVRLLPGPQ